MLRSRGRISEILVTSLYLEFLHLSSKSYKVLCVAAMFFEHLVLSSRIQFSTYSLRTSVEA